jgi:tRNA-2-methylthio-N6-dimethylallyladenosine synthase
VRSFHIRTFGCQMNVADSELMAGILSARGMAETDDPALADVIVVNTCSIRRKAEEKGVSEIGRALSLKKRGVSLVVAVGCVARQEGEALLRRLPGLDVVLGPNRLSRLGDALDERVRGGRPVVDVDDGAAPAVGALPLRRGGVTAFTSIMRGCDNRCAYCIVPSVRGRETSRPSDDIVREIRDLTARGYREVTLLGQNVNSYRDGLGAAGGFPRLLERLQRESGIGRIRFTTSHPKDFTPALAAAIRDLPAVCEWVHLPLQAGADRILTAMNRGYTAGAFREKVAFLRETVPGVSISTDIIVGFPGEREEDFEETRRLVDETGFTSLFAFKFSPRAGTPAAALHDDVPAAEKDRRLQVILALQRRRTIDFHESLVGTVAEVLVEGESRLDAGAVTGRTRGNQVVNFTSPGSPAGSLLDVRLIAARPHSLLGEPVRRQTD